MCAVHPRVGGEHHEFFSVCEDFGGSSPRGRGTRQKRALLRARRRFIPAWAGNTGACDGSGAGVPVHPRVGGEHWIRTAPNIRGCGSSPRGRGTQITDGLRKAGRRFIPAWAGNTRLCGRTGLTPSVHPRVGGEHHNARAWGFPPFGSSPRGRGTPGCSNPASGTARFIPAWAGNTLQYQNPVMGRAVHPRVGGEHGGTYCCGTDRIGSSPRGRGTRKAVVRVPYAPRFIPAWAGNTL